MGFHMSLPGDITLPMNTEPPPSLCPRAGHRGGGLSSNNNLTVTNLINPFNYIASKSVVSTQNGGLIKDILSMKRSRKRKLAYRVQKNVLQMCETFGNRVGFLTITFPEDLKIWKKAHVQQASLSFIRFRKNFIDKYCEHAYIKVIEGTKKGRIHYHLLIVFKEEIFNKFNWSAYEYQKKHTIRNHRYHGIQYASLMAIMEKKALNAGMGRLDLTPIKHHGKASKYVSKYIMKYQALILCRGYRQITFSVKIASSSWCCSSRFGWVGTTSKRFRLLINEWAIKKGITEDLLPKGWFHSFRRDVGLNC